MRTLKKQAVAVAIAVAMGVMSGSAMADSIAVSTKSGDGILIATDGVVSVNAGPGLTFSADTPTKALSLDTTKVVSSLTVADNGGYLTGNSTTGAVTLTLSDTAKSVLGSGITADKVSAYDSYATTKQDTLTTAQQAAVDSGITADKVSTYDTYVTTSGLNANNQVISNVAAGTNLTDAVNLAQLTLASIGTQIAADATVLGLESKVGVVYTGTVDTPVSLTGDAGLGYGKVIASNMNLGGAVAIGQGAVVQSQSASIAIGGKANGTYAVALGSGATANANNSVALGAGSVANEAYTVSVGNGTTNNRIVNVANPINATDATNKQYVDNAVYNQDKRMEKKVNRLGAKSAAIAALHPMPFDEDHKVSASVGAGTYGGEGAAAVGVFYRPTENLMFNVAGAAGSGCVMGNLGVSYRFGGSGSSVNTLTKSQMVQKVTMLEDTNRSVEAQLKASLSREEASEQRNQKARIEIAQLKKSNADANAKIAQLQKASNEKFAKMEKQLADMQLLVQQLAASQKK